MLRKAKGSKKIAVEFFCRPGNFLPAEVVVGEVYKYIHLSEESVNSQLQRLRLILIRQDVAYLSTTTSLSYNA